MAKLDLLGSFPKIATSGAVQTETVKANVVKGHMNKIMFAFSDAIKDAWSIGQHKVTVKHISDRVTTLIPNLLLRPFVDITNEKFGGVYGQADTLALLLKSYVDAGGVDANLISSLTNASKWKIVACILDLGSFDLTDGDELHVTIERYANDTENAPALEVYSVSDEPNEPFHFLNYDVDFDMNELHRNVRELYIYPVIGGGYSVEVDSPSSQYSANKDGLQAWSMLSGSHEQRLPEALKLYESEIPEDVAVKISGNNQGDTGVLAVRVSSDINRYAVQQRMALKKQAGILESYERNEPETATVFQAAGLPTSTDLENKADEFKDVNVR